jgi:hypothetical protein
MDETKHKGDALREMLFTYNLQPEDLQITKEKVPVENECGVTASISVTDENQCIKDKTSKCCLVKGRETPDKSVCVKAGTDLNASKETSEKIISSLYDIYDVSCNYRPAPSQNNCGNTNKGQFDASISPRGPQDCYSSKDCCYVSFDFKNEKILSYVPNRFCLKSLTSDKQANKERREEYLKAIYGGDVLCGSGKEEFPKESNCGIVSGLGRRPSDAEQCTSDSLKRCCYVVSGDDPSNSVCLSRPHILRSTSKIDAEASLSSIYYTHNVVCGISPI